MKKLLLGTCIFLSGLMISSAMAGENTGATAFQGKMPAQEVVSTETGVSQTQIDIVTQREEARQRRDAMLKKRAATIKAAEQKNRKRR